MILCRAASHNSSSTSIVVVGVVVAGFIISPSKISQGRARPTPKYTLITMCHKFKDAYTNRHSTKSTESSLPRKASSQ
jgi:hypothetical protein